MGTNADQTIMELAAGQHGVVTRRQLLAVGLAPDSVDRRLRVGRLRRAHRGVYLVGPVEAPRAREMAAALACGRGAAISHRSAAVLWQIPEDARPPALVEVADRTGAHRKPGIRIRHIHTLRPDEVTRRDGIPVTTPPRTIYDLASVVRKRQVERALAEALARRLTTRDAVAEILARNPRGAGRRTLAAILQDGRPTLTRSEAEERFLALVRDARLEAPEANVVVEDYEVDFLWRAQRLVIEVDGYAFHSSHDAFERDRRRDVALTAAGLRVIRLTWKQITEEPLVVLRQVIQALARGPV